MIDIREQEDKFIVIGRALNKKMHVYAIGGTALMLHGIKNSTLDVDLVFDEKSDRQDFFDALLKLGAKGSDVTLVYGEKENTPLMLEFDNCRFDMFTRKIITSNFSDGMKERAKQTHEFGNLIIKPADALDVLIMKSVTSRSKDDDDIVLILNNVKVNWDIIIKEAEEQVRLGNEATILTLGEKLERLSNKKLISVPKEVLDSLWKLLNKQVKKRKRN